MTADAMFVSSDDEIRSILLKASTVALVGASPKPWRDSHGIMAMLLAAGYNVIPVNPNYDEVLGRACAPDLRSVNAPIDIVNVFRRPSALLPLMEDAIVLKAPVVWLQPGAFEESAARRAASAGLRVVCERCIAVEYRMLANAPRSPMTQ